MINDICKVCGLSKDICVCEEIRKDKTHISIRYEDRKYGRHVTILDIDGDANIKRLETYLKKFLACGGTHTGNKILLQGKHKSIKSVLEGKGYKC